MSTIMEKKLPTRAEMNKEFQWRLTHIYLSDAEWEADFSKLKSLTTQCTAYQSDFLESAANLLKTLQLKDEIGRLTDKLYVYARMSKDQDNANPVYQALTDRIQGLSAEIAAGLSFILPSLLKLPEAKLEDYCREVPELNLYQRFFAEVFRQKKHILSDAEERILARSSEMAETAALVFGMLDNADLRFPTIVDENGNEIELTKGRYIKFLESKERRVRQEAFEALYSTYQSYQNTLAATLSSAVKTDVFYARMRQFPSALVASLDDDHISVAVYEGLIQTIHNYLPALQDYLKLRKKMLDLSDLHMYDLYAPLVSDYQNNVTYDQAKELVSEALRPLGAEYLEILQQGFQNGWIDVYENQGKTSGAYAFGSYDTHPYVLTNYQGKVHDVFTLAHEMGHALHSYYSNQNQPYVYAGYRIFVAEVASTVNETLLMEYLLAKTTNRAEKLYLLNQYLEQFRTTVFRQTMFAEFEKIIHEEIENGGALTAEIFSQKYFELNQLYYGAQAVIDPEIKMEWARIPHFYSAFYVYKYATGYTAAIALARRIFQGDAEARERYLEFLKSGDSDDPLNLLRKAGVDMERPEPISRALDVFQELLGEMAELAGVEL